MVMLILYFIVGLFTVINQQFQIPLQTAMLPHDGNITNALVTMLNFSWFLAYPLSEGFGTRWLEKYGYRKTSYLALLILIAGLAIYEAAVLFHIYTPMQVSIIGNHISVGFFIFLIGSFVIGVAATILQVVLNLYLTVCRIGKNNSLAATDDRRNKQLDRYGYRSVGNQLSDISRNTFARHRDEAVHYSTDHIDSDHADYYYFSW